MRRRVFGGDALWGGSCRGWGVVRGVALAAGTCPGQRKRDVVVEIRGGVVSRWWAVEDLLMVFGVMFAGEGVGVGASMSGINQFSWASERLLQRAGGVMESERHTKNSMVA